MKPSGPRIRRVVSMELTNFRGFCGRGKQLNTDADIVLITGPNGFGKTSLIDALCKVLTGHHYQDRCPLVCSLANAQRAVLAAEIDTGARGNSSIEIVIEKNDQMQREVEPWKERPNNDRVIAARASFFYQDMLRHVFEEESPQVTLENFLTTAPVNTLVMTSAVKSAHDTMTNFAMNLGKGLSIPTAQEVDGERARAADDFKVAWEKAAESHALAASIDLPSLPPLTRQQGDYMRVQWKESLARFAKECDSMLGGHLSSRPEAQGSPIEVLTWLDWIIGYSSHVSNQIDDAMRKEQFDQKNIPMLLADLEDAEIMLTEKRLQEGKLQLVELGARGRELELRLSLLYSLERHFKPQTETGVGLSGIVDALRRLGPEWLDPPKDPRIEPEWLVPSDVVSWLGRAVKGLDECVPPVDCQLCEWNNRIAENRMALERERAQVVAQMRSLQRSIQASTLVADLVREHQGMSLRVTELKNEGKDRVRGSELVSMFGTDAKAPAALKNPMADVLMRLRAWRQLEEGANQYEEQRRRSSAYKRAYTEAAALRDALDEERKKATSILANIELVPPNAQISFAQDVSSILEHFYCVPGIHPVKLDRAGEKGRRLWRIRSEDGRALSSFSSGQKAQLAVSTILALNAALHEMLWFDVVAFDDFTSALDMTQLPRLATLMRQVAYGAPDGFEGRTPFKRQVFIVSHHEDLTNRLAGFLIPPEGRTMRILNFTGWDPKNGPQVDQLDVRPAASANNVRDALGRLSEEVLSGRYGG
jgi:energy-coupling factor transporter ATP-binding protein EcfA2